MSPPISFLPSANLNNLLVHHIFQQMSGRTGFCEICNKQVEIINVITSSNYDQFVFSCGDTSKIIKRSLEKPVSIDDKIWSSKQIKIESLSNISIPVIVSGDGGIKAHGLLAPTFKISMENGNYIIDKPRIWNLSLNDERSDSVFSIPNILDHILVKLDESGHSQREKTNIRKILNQIDRQIKLKPLPSIISSLGTLETYLHMAAPYVQLLISNFVKANPNNQEYKDRISYF
jgi:hypothetical protein